MALDLPAGREGTADAIAFGVAADLTYTVFGATNSSPQTTELFAAQRAGTLWKYVKLGGLQAVILVGVMAFRAGAGGGWARAFWPAAGGVVTGVMMWAMYAHALAAGQDQPPPSAARTGGRM